MSRSHEGVWKTGVHIQASMAPWFGRPRAAFRTHIRTCQLPMHACGSLGDGGSFSFSSRDDILENRDFDGVGEVNPAMQMERTWYTSRHSHAGCCSRRIRLNFKICHDQQTERALKRTSISVRVRCMRELR